MTEQTHSANGTVAEEAARLIEAMASMARSTASAGQEGRAYADGPARESAPSAAHEGSPSSDNGDEPLNGACSACGSVRDSTPVACKLCPMCQGIAFIRSIRPETVDRLADLAAAVASGLRDMAAQSRGPGQGPGAQSRGPGLGPDTRSSSSRGRATVQDIYVAEETEG